MLVVRLASERMVPLIVALVVVGAAAVSLQPGPARAVGGTDGGGGDVRIAIGGGNLVDGLDGMEVAGVSTRPGLLLADAGPVATSPTSTFADDGTIYKPVAVGTTVQDGSGLLETYTVQSGDTLTGIASQFGLSMMTLWWANSLDSKDSLHVGQKLVIPPVDGLVVTVKAGDTLDSLAAAYGSDATAIVDVNGLEDPNLVVGQTLVLPGAHGAAIPTPKPTKRPVVTSGGGSCNCSGPTKYSGGKFLWPVVGGNNYISQYFHYGHYAIDIAANYGSTVRAAAAGRVVFAGWKNNGGGYQVWISHGSNFYTTYNHMSAITVATGQSVSRGQQVGRIGMTGNATGPHLHFEVWIGPVWNGGYRVNPLKYL